MSRVLTPALRRALPDDVRAAIAAARRATPASRRLPAEIHLLKRRERRRASFYGGVRQLAHGMRVQWGVVEKVVSPGRAQGLLDRHRAVTSALDSARRAGGAAIGGVTPRAVPRAPRLLGTDLSAGRILFEAFEGVPLPCVGAGSERLAAVGRVAAHVAALERIDPSDWAAERWTGTHEWLRLVEVWQRAGEALPAWADALRARIDPLAARTPAHRDLYADQVIVRDPDDPCDRWIDWDLAAVAPVGLDLGNFLAHERLATLSATRPARDSGTRSSEQAWDEVRRAYREAGGTADSETLRSWDAVASLRLAGLVIQRARGDDPIERNARWLESPPADAELARRLVDEARALAAR